jgi:hypothetical protein
MATLVGKTQVIPAAHPAGERPLWKRIVAVFQALRFPKSDGLKMPAANGADDQELHTLAKRVNAGPTDRGAQQDVFVVLYGGGVFK